MAIIDLRQYIFDSSGTWTDPSKADDNATFPFTAADTMAADRLMLRWSDDTVVLAGPLSVHITVQSENYLVSLSQYRANKVLSTGVVGADERRASLQASTLYSYTLDIPAGQAWPFRLEDADVGRAYLQKMPARMMKIGNNLGHRILIEPAIKVLDKTPVRVCDDLPCDYAVANQTSTTAFFPVACEPCEPGASIGLPPANAVALVTPPAPGGCVRTRFFNGMFITREDLETEQRYHRLKSKLHNRAAGSGVVWGLNVGKQSGAVWVLPGYAVDCCGNDLTVTATYKVDIDALLADPAAAERLCKGGAQKMHLLLEHVDCPTDPRPVHGDPCGPAAPRCEMSRIRETVRLRLVPPREYDARTESAPIQGLLDEIKALRERYGMTAVKTPLAPRTAPFALRIVLREPNGQTPITASLRPEWQGQDPDLAKIRGAVSTMDVDIVLDPLWVFTGGKITAKAVANDEDLEGVVSPSSQDLSPGENGEPQKVERTRFQIPVADVRALDLTFRIQNWRAQTLFAGEDDFELGSEEVVFTVRLQNDGSIVERGLSTTEILTRPAAILDPPCKGDRCDARTRTDTFVNRLSGAIRLTEVIEPPSVLPFLHTDPIHPGQSADAKVAVLAGLGAWLAQMLVREQAGTKAEVWTTRRMIASYLYSGAWLFLFGVHEPRARAELGAMLKRFFQALCDSLLWKGPQCKEEPHGVVIGCAMVEGGTITQIDPFGGRRHVVHYPLLSHWGAQFGIAPPDITASRFFSVLCCISALPAIGEQPLLEGGLIAVGNGFVAVGVPEKIQSKIAEKHILVASERRVSAAELVASAVDAAGRKAVKVSKAEKVVAGSQDLTPYRALVLDDVVADHTVMLLLPVEA